MPVVGMDFVKDTCNLKLVKLSGAHLIKMKKILSYAISVFNIILLSIIGVLIGLVLLNFIFPGILKQVFGLKWIN